MESFFCQVLHTVISIQAHTQAMHRLHLTIPALLQLQLYFEQGKRGTCLGCRKNCIYHTCLLSEAWPHDWNNQWYDYFCFLSFI